MRKFRVTVDGRPYEVTVEVLEEEGGGPAPSPQLPPPRPVAARVALPPAAPVPAAPAAPAPAGLGEVVSPLAGTIVEVNVAAGQSVQPGDRLMTLEAMKMNTAVAAPQAGTVREIRVETGATVQEGQVLLILS